MGYESELERLVQAYSRNWGPIRWRPQVEALAPSIDPRNGELFWALSNIEDDSFYMRTKIRYGGIDRIRSLADFNAIWLAEESEHSRALGALAMKHGFDRPRLAHHALARDRRSLLAVPLLRAGGLYRDGMVAAYLTLGCIQEYVALTVYNAIAGTGVAAPVRQTLKDIARQEGRHMRFYRSSAIVVLSASRSSQAFTRQIISRYWRPPGIDLLGVEHWSRIFLPILLDTEVKARILRTDDLLARLPGMSGTRIMSTFLNDLRRSDPYGPNIDSRPTLTSAS